MSKHEKVEKRGAAELAALLNKYPAWINELNNLDVLEMAEGLEVTPWEKDPVHLMDEVRSLQTTEVGDDGNFVN